MNSNLFQSSVADRETTAEASYAVECNNGATDQAIDGTIRETGQDTENEKDIFETQNSDSESHRLENKQYARENDIIDVLATDEQESNNEQHSPVVLIDTNDPSVRIPMDEGVSELSNENVETVGGNSHELGISGKLPTFDTSFYKNFPIHVFGGSFQRKLVMEAIKQLEDDESNGNVETVVENAPDLDISGENSTLMSTFDTAFYKNSPILAYDEHSEREFVMKPTEDDDVLETSEREESVAKTRPKRNCKTKPELICFLKSRRSMPVSG